MQAKYVVASKRNRTVRSFDDAKGVAAFMWGRDFNDWLIYQRQDNLPVELGACETVLNMKDKLDITVVNVPASAADKVTK